MHTSPFIQYNSNMVLLVNLWDKRYLVGICYHHIAKRSVKSEIRNIVSPESSQIPILGTE